MMRKGGRVVAFAAIVCLIGVVGFAGEIDRKDLLIAGLTLEVDLTPVVAGIGVAASVQTRFGGKTNESAPPDQGMTAIGDLSGPGIESPIRLITKPGYAFQLPALYQTGDYVLRNIRLIGPEGNVLQTAVPSFANITITQVLDTKVSVHQLTPEDLRARGITVDANNYDVFEYTFIFAIHGEAVSVPYPVLIDKRTHEVVKAPTVDPYQLPSLPAHQTPPRFQPPQTYPFPLNSFVPGDPTLPQSSEDSAPHRIVSAIPAAIVIPSGFGVLHQFQEGASHSNAAPVRQFIHGGMGMDDPIEVVTPGARVFPVFDEAGAGNLQAIIGEDGHLIARVVTGDPYGEEQRTISGPTIDEVKLTAKKDPTGALTEVRVTMHSTEPLEATTLVAGTRLASVTADGTLVRISPVPPTQPNPYTVAWTLPSAEWASLIAGAKTASVSIAATSSLRSTTYGPTVALQPAQPSANGFSTSTLPIEVRESLAAAQIQFASTGTDTAYSIPTLTTLGTAQSDATATLIMSPFQALPFTEPVTGLVNARNRWYDAGTGSWVSPDPMGYIDSSNLYAFAGGDPVDRRDPAGLYQLDFHYYAIYFLARAAGMEFGGASDIAWASQFVDNAPQSDPILNSVNGHAENVRLLHFLAPPGQLVTRNNPLVQKVVDDASLTGNPIRFGITLHTLADSYSHEGFVAGWDARNLRSGPMSKMATAAHVIAAQNGIALPLELPGHAGEDERGEANDKPFNDVEKAIDASRQIFIRLSSFAAIYYGTPMPGKRFEEIESTLRRLFTTTGDTVRRVSVWQVEIARTFEATVYRPEERNGLRRSFTPLLMDQLRRAQAASR